MSFSVDRFKSYVLSGNPSAPDSIRRFDQVTKISVSLSIIGFLITVLGHPMMMMAAGGGLITGLIILALYIALFYLIVMDAKPWAKWVYSVLFGIGLIGMLMSLSMISISALFMFGALMGIINLVQILLGAYSVFLLFQSDSARFFKSSESH